MANRAKSRPVLFESRRVILATVATSGSKAHLLDYTLNVITGINFFASVMVSGASIAASVRLFCSGNRQSRCHKETLV
jgi:hypothetical protein